MKNGSTHIVHQSEHAGDMDSRAVLAVTLHGGAATDTHTLHETMKLTCEKAAADGQHETTSGWITIADWRLHHQRLSRQSGAASQKIRISKARLLPPPEGTTLEVAARTSAPVNIVFNRPNTQSPMNVRIGIFVALLSTLAADPATPTQGDPTNCVGCGAGGGGTAAGGWPDPLGIDSVNVLLITKISPGACVIKPEVTPNCQPATGCPITLEVSYISTQPVAFEAIDPSTGASTNYTQPAASGWTQGGIRHVRIGCGDMTATAKLCFQIAAQPTQECISVDFTCDYCGDASTL